MGAFYGIHGETAGPSGPFPGPKWNALANLLRQEDRLRDAGTLVGYMTMAIMRSRSSDLIRAAGQMYANDVQPPFNPAEHALFNGGIEQVISVNEVTGRIA